MNELECVVERGGKGGGVGQLKHYRKTFLDTIVSFGVSRLLRRIDVNKYSSCGPVAFQ